MLGSLQLGSRVCISVSTNHWYLRSLPPFPPNLIVHMHIQTLKTQTVANIIFTVNLAYTTSQHLLFLWSILGIGGKQYTWNTNYAIIDMIESALTQLYYVYHELL